MSNDKIQSIANEILETDKQKLKDFISIANKINSFKSNALIGMSGGSLFGIIYCGLVLLISSEISNFLFPMMVAFGASTTIYFMRGKIWSKIEADNEFEKKKIDQLNYQLEMIQNQIKDLPQNAPENMKAALSQKYVQILEETKLLEHKS
jgi:hypothetical protein